MCAYTVSGCPFTPQLGPRTERWEPCPLAGAPSFQGCATGGALSIVKAKLQAKKSEFISIDEVLGLLCQKDGCSIEEGAQYLFDLLSTYGEQIEYVWSSMVHGLCIADRSPFITDIHKIAQGLNVDPWDESNTLEYGFYRAAIFSVLAKEGIYLEAVALAPKKELPSWAWDCRAIRRYTQSQAARVLVGTDPMNEAWQGDDWQRDIDRAHIALSQALEDQLIVPVDASGEPIFNAADLRLWAISHGYEWPIPEIQPSAGPAPALSSSASVASDDILKRLQDSERARHELQAEVDKLKAEAAQVKQQTELLAKQAALIGKLENDFALAQDEIRELKNEIGQGKALSTWQKIAVGLAVKHYDFQLGTGRSSTAADISAALASVKITVTAETVRNSLKAAAEAHLPIRR